MARNCPTSRQRRRPCFLAAVLSNLLWLLVVSSTAVPVDGAEGDWRGPRDRFWRHHVLKKSLILDGVDYWNDMETCLHSHLTEQDFIDMETDRADRQVGLKVTDDFRNDKIILVNIERAMTPLHVRAVQALAACTRTLFPDFYEARSFYVEMGLDEDEGLGGNNPTHLAPLVGIFLPAVAAEIQRTLQLAYDVAGWAEFSAEKAEANQVHTDDILPTPDEIGFRASEHLTYVDYKDGLAEHTDGPETHFTVNFAFSGPDDYDGGFFFLRYGEGDLWGEGRNPKEQMLIKPNKYDCMVFLGGPYLHGVTDITGGHREMFSSELWAFPDTPFGSTLWMNRAGRMTEYIRLCNELNHTAGTQCEVDMTSIQPENGDFVEGMIGGYGGDEQDFDEMDGFTDDDDEEDVIQHLANRLTPVEWQETQTGKVVSIADFVNPSDEPYFLVPRNLQTGDMSPVYWRGRANEDSTAPQPVPDLHVVSLTNRLVQAFQSLVARAVGPLAQYHLQDGSLTVESAAVETEGWQTTRIRAFDETDLIRMESVASPKAVQQLQETLAEADFGSVLEHVTERLSGGDGGTAWVVKTVQILALSYAIDVTSLHLDNQGMDDKDAALLIPLGIEGDEAYMGFGEFNLDNDSDDGIEWGDMALNPRTGILLGKNTPFSPNDTDMDGMHLFVMVWMGQQPQQDSADGGRRHNSTTNVVWPPASSTCHSDAEGGHCRDGTLPMALQQDKQLSS